MRWRHISWYALAIGGWMLVAVSGCTDSKTASIQKNGDAAEKRRFVNSPEEATNPGVRLGVVTDAISFVYQNDQDAKRYTILESLGGGVGILDYDLDGQPDIFLPGGGYFSGAQELKGHDSGLFRNRHGDFIRCDSPAAVSSSAWYSHGAAIADYDNDGFPDVLVTGYGGLTLFRNMGDGVFDQQSAESTGLTDRLWSTSAGWGDLNNDGNIDLYVVHYTNWSVQNDPICRAGQMREVCPPSTYESLPDVVYFNNEDGSFRDATLETGIRNDGKGLGVIVGDLENDGDVDVYVANDTVANFLYRNSGGGKLQDHTLRSGASHSASALPEGSMGVDLCDYNNDGEPDLWVANYERENFGLYRNLGNGGCLFRHVSQETGIDSLGGLYVGWGTVFCDLDNDGDQDGFVANGHVVRHPTVAPIRQQPLVLWNQNGNRIENITESTGDYGRDQHMGRGVAAADLDRDGDLDLVVSHINSPAIVLQNNSRGGNWLRLRLIGQTNRNAIGARVTIQCEAGLQYRQVFGGGSYASTHETTLHFGIGSAAAVNSVEVTWPDGDVQTLSHLNPGDYTIIQGRVMALQLCR